MKNYYFILMLLISIFFIGCGTSEEETKTNEAPPEIKTGYLIDSAISGVKYTSNKGDSGITNEDGSFKYTEGSKILFKIGGVELGEISTINTDSKVFLQDIVGVDRTDTLNDEVIKLAIFLQSLDSDGDRTNGISIENKTKEKLSNENKIIKSITIADVEDLVVNKAQKELVNESDAIYHLNTVLIENNIVQEENIIGNVDKKYFGKWLYLSNGNTKIILSSTNLDGFKAIDDNLIQIKEDGKVYSLMRDSIANIKVKGLIDNDTVESRGISDIGDIDVILQNVLDNTIKAEVKTDKDGLFEDNTLPSGTYKLTAKDTTKELDTIVEIVNEEEDLGVFKLTGEDLNNYKAELILDSEFIYADKQEYTGKIRVHNISTVDGLALNYEINASDEYLKSFNANTVVATGSVDAKTYKDIPLTISVNPFFENERTIDVNVKIKDFKNTTWIDTFKFTVYKGTFDINVDTSKSNVKGYIILPNTHTIKSINMSSGTITLPLLDEKTYSLVLSNPNIDEETAYSIGINNPTQTFETFQDTSAHEPNDKETEAKTISLNQSIISYLHKTDIDFWKIDTPEYPVLFLDSDENFNTLENIDLKKEVVSNTITITSIKEGSEITANITTGTIILNGVDTQTNQVVLKDNDKIAIKLTSSDKVNTEISSILSFGNIKKIFSVKTVPSIAGSFEKVLGANVGSTYTSNNIIISNIDEGKSIIVVANNAILIKNNIEQNSSSVEVQNNDTVALKVNYTDENPVFATLDIAGDIKIYLVSKNETIKDGDVVTDYKTNLTWTDISANKDTKLDYLDAKSYCANLNIAGKDDWRLPTIVELESIVDTSTDTNFDAEFSYIASESSSNRYWSTTPANYDNYYKGVNTEGITYHTNGLYKTTSYNFRCVSGDDTYDKTITEKVVVDNSTNLTWTDTPDNEFKKLKYLDAKSYCDNLDIANINTWRLPTIEELESIVDTSTDTKFKTDFLYVSDDTYFYYRSTTVGDSGEDYQKAIKYDGSIYNDGIPKTYPYNFRCIKDY